MLLPQGQTVEPFGKVDVYSHPEGIRVIARIFMKPQVEGAQTGLAIDGSNSMTQMFGAHLPPLLRKADQNVMQAIGSSMSQALADFDSDGKTSVIYWACGNGGGDIEILGDMDASEASKFKFVGPKKFGTGTKLSPAVRYFGIEKFKTSPWSISVFITDGIIEDLEDVKEVSLEIAQQMADGQRGFTKFVMIGLGDSVDESQMEELNDMDYAGLETPDGEEIDLWDHSIAAEMQCLDEIFKECVGENSLIASSATILDSYGKAVKPLRRNSYADGLPALIEFVCSHGATSFTLTIPEVGSFTQPLV